jgi:hypothetical protein
VVDALLLLPAILLPLHLHRIFTLTNPLPPHQPEFFAVRILQPLSSVDANREFVLAVVSGDTVGDIKAKVVDKTGEGTADTLKMVFDGTLLTNDSKTAEEYGIRANAQLNVVQGKK